MQNRIRSVKILEEVIGYFIHHEIDHMDIKFFADEKKMDITVSGTTEKPQKIISIWRICSMNQLSRNMRNITGAFWGPLENARNCGSWVLL